MANFYDINFHKWVVSVTFLVIPISALGFTGLQKCEIRARDLARSYNLAVSLCQASSPGADYNRVCGHGLYVFECRKASDSVCVWIPVMVKAILPGVLDQPIFYEIYATASDGCAEPNLEVPPDDSYTPVEKECNQ